MKTLSSIGLGLLLAAGLSTAALAEGGKVDPKLAAYKPTSGVSGNLSSVGSDTLANLMTFTFGYWPWSTVLAGGQVPKGALCESRSLVAGDAMTVDLTAKAESVHR